MPAAKLALSPRRLSAASLVTVLGILVSAGMQIVRIFSLVVLVYAGMDPALLADGLGYALIGASISGVWIALRISMPGAHGTPPALPAVLVALAVSGAAALAAPEQRSATVLATVTAAGLITGLVLLLLGVTGAGRLIRYVPHAVIGGVIAATGWSLVEGAMAMSAAPIGAALLSAEAALRWLPGVGLGLLLFWLKRAWHQPLLVPAAVVLATAVFYAVAGSRGFGVEQLQQDGWLLGPLPQGSSWLLPPASAWFEADLLAVSTQLPTLLTAAFAAALLAGLYGSATELKLKVDSRPNGDLRHTGIANLLSAGFVSLPNVISPTSTGLAFSIRVRRRVDAALTPLVMLLVVVIGVSRLEIVPIPVLAALLASLGFENLYDWLVDGRRRLSWVDQSVVLVIVVTTAVSGLVAGVGVGLALAAGLFILAAARTDVVARADTGQVLRSRVTRSAAARQHLRSEGERILVYRLGGMVFFGTADNLVERVSQRLGQSPVPKFIVLDVASAGTFDATGGVAVVRLARAAHAVGAQVVMVGAGTAVREALALVDARVSFAKDLDHALESCENRLLEDAGLAGEKPRFEDVLHELPGGEAAWSALAPRFGRVSLKAGQALVRQGDPGDSFWILEKGRITAVHERVDGSQLRLETLGPGRVVGELSFVIGEPRSADLIAEEPAELFRMDRQGWARIAEEEPALAVVLRDLLLRLAAERVGHLATALAAARE